LRFESQTVKQMSVSYPENPASIGDHIRKNRTKATSKKRGNDLWR
jgi:hypothetical protein